MLQWAMTMWSSFFFSVYLPIDKSIVHYTLSVPYNSICNSSCSLGIKTRSFKTEPQRLQNREYDQDRYLQYKGFKTKTESETRATLLI